MPNDKLLEIEELEPRIAPHGALGGGHAAVLVHGGHELILPNGNEIELPGAAEGGIERALGDY